MTISELRAMRKTALKADKQLYARLNNRSGRVVALTECAPRYGCPAFRCPDGNGWYPVTGAEFTFEVQ